jgi:hypothetical protein
MRKTGLNKSLEKRMWLVWLALKLGMILASEEIGMIAQLDQFRQCTIG